MSSDSDDEFQKNDNEDVVKMKVPLSTFNNDKQEIPSADGSLIKNDIAHDNLFVGERSNPGAATSSSTAWELILESGVKNLNFTYKDLCSSCQVSKILKIAASKKFIWGHLLKNFSIANGSGDEHPKTQIKYQVLNRKIQASRIQMETYEKEAEYIRSKIQLVMSDCHHGVVKSNRRYCLESASLKGRKKKSLQVESGDVLIGLETQLSLTNRKLSSCRIEVAECESIRNKINLMKQDKGD